MYTDLLVLGLELIVALASVLSEHMLARGKLNGWVWSIIGSALAGFFFLLKGHTILALVEVLSVPFAIYGLQKWRRPVEKTTRTDNIMAYGALVVIIVYFFCGGVDMDAIYQGVASGGFLIGGLLIARNKKLGWYISIVADTLLAYVLLESNDYIFVCFQVISIGIAIHKTFFKKSIRTEHGPSGPCFSFLLLRTSIHAILAL